MKRKAIISVNSKQSGMDDVIEVVTPGEFYKKENLYYAVYKETELSGMEGTTTTLRIDNDKFCLIRMGSTTTRMDFDKTKDTVSMYNTPYGTMELKIETKILDIDINENGGTVLIKYNMSVSGGKPQDTLLNIKIKAQE